MIMVQQAPKRRKSIVFLIFGYFKAITTSMNYMKLSARESLYA